MIASICKRSAAAGLDRLGRSLGFLWGGWAGLAAVFLLAAVWQAGHEAYGAFVLPRPEETLRAAWAILQRPDYRAIVALSLLRALEGFAMASILGVLLGLASGYSPASLRLARPLLTLMLGVPPIAWIVLAMIWFGIGQGTILATIVIAVAPVLFVGAVEGVAQRDRGLDILCQAFGAGPFRRFWASACPQAMQQIFPALALGLGVAVKVAVMAELLTHTVGIGRLLATARANLDITEALAWVLIAVGGLILLEYGVLHPLRAEAERWRDASRAWGVRR
ncbi:ABC transporter permease [Elstera cyanobacteriorum]|uniref:ABC transporter permease n=1 Tax=Elstera cyanobacteriorum TaxID=2022747 RepID=A0A255XQW0_9PROT|nr:ABC transporter permease subunit [Elstera cyanobacteriorum]OYQ19271.1 ABC transporter permease [Elstera cyanobacteriorum]GFZ90209.1 ABC transporter permease [Elstera cyanobacteriorum]